MWLGAAIAVVAALLLDDGRGVARVRRSTSRGRRNIAEPVLWAFGGGAGLAIGAIVTGWITRRIVPRSPRSSARSVFLVLVVVGYNNKDLRFEDQLVGTLMVVVVPAYVGVVVCGALAAVLPRTSTAGVRCRGTRPRPEPDPQLLGSTLGRSQNTVRPVYLVVADRPLHSTKGYSYRYSNLAVRLVKTANRSGSRSLLAGLVAIIVASLSVVEPPVVEVAYVYTTDADDLLHPLITEFNDAGIEAGGHRAESRRSPEEGLSSGTALFEQIEDGDLQPEAWTPASSLWVSQLDANWPRHRCSSPSLVQSPQVVVTFDPQLAVDANMLEGVLDRAESGEIKLGHTDPHFSTSGLSAAPRRVLHRRQEGAGVAAERCRRPNRA